MRLLVGRCAEGEWNVVVEHHLLVARCEGEVAAQPLHLPVGELARRPVGFALCKLHVVEAHIVFIATVERIVGGSPALFPFPAVEGVAVLVVVAYDGEQAHA